MTYTVSSGMLNSSIPYDTAVLWQSFYHQSWQLNKTYDDVVRWCWWFVSSGSSCFSNSTQLNTNTEERSSGSLYKSPIFEKKIVNSILSNVPQLIILAGKLFHASITLIVKKKYFLASKQTWGLESLSLWPLSPVNDLVHDVCCT